MVEHNPKLKYTQVLVKELKSGTTKNQKTCPIVLDQRGDQWWLFNNEKVELNHGYAFGYELSENGQFKNLKDIIPLENIFIQAALKELSSKLDITKNISVATGYAKDLTTSQIIKVENLFEWADKIYNYITTKCDVEFERINNSGINPKDIK